MIESISPVKYFLEVNICLLLFYAVYHVFLKKDTFFQCRRGYLIITPLVSLLLPFLNFGAISTITNLPTTALNIIPKTIDNFQQNEFFFQAPFYQHASGFNLSLGDLLFWFYLLICSLFILKLLHSLWKLSRLIYKHPIQSEGPYKVIQIDSDIPAFSFFNYLFWNGKKDENTTLIFEHEKTHMRQKHSFDVLLIEIMVALFWVNPIIYLIRKQLKTVHEYIADEHVLNQSVEREQYAALLVNLFTAPNPNQLVTSFNSQIKNRLSMMYQKKSPRFSLLKSIAVIPALMLLLALFSFDLANVDSLVSTIENTTEKSVFTFPDSATEEKDYDRPYVLRFGNIDFELTEQIGEGTQSLPPTFVLTYKTAQDIAQEKPVLLNRNNNQIYTFITDSRITKKSLDKTRPYSNQLNLKDLLSDIDVNKISYISIKNLKPTGEDIVLNLRISVVPESSFQMEWGNQKFTIGAQLNMSGNDFVTLAAVHPLTNRNALYQDMTTQFQKMEIISANGKSKAFNMRSFQFPKNAAISKIYKSVISNAKAGDRFIFKGIQVESSNVPSEYFFEVNITSDADDKVLGDLMPSNNAKTIQYILNGNAIDQSTFEKINPDDIIELKMLDKFGRPTTDTNEDRVVIIRTTNQTAPQKSLAVYVLNGKTVTKSVIDQLNPDDILEYKVYNRFGELIGDDKAQQRYIQVRTKE